VELKQGDHIKVAASKYPFPTVCADKQSTDWFQSISRTLKWNERERQKSFVMVEEEPLKARPSKRVSTPPTNLGAGQSALAEGDEGGDGESDEEDKSGDEGEEKYDIDDSANPSTKNTRPPSVASSAAPSGRNTPAHSTFSTKKELSLSSIAPSESPNPPLAGNLSDIDMHEDGFRDNIHSPKFLTHGAKSAIPKDRDIDSMRTPRAHEAVHPHIRHHHPHHPQNTGTRARIAHLHGPTPSNLNPGLAPRLARSTHLRIRGHRPSRSADFERTNRAFAVWGQDESDSNTDSEA